ncbi:MAG: recombinase family protein [Bacteroidales bacterium]|nr:recombinase family protein [Bacteroidales bacterium]
MKPKTARTGTPQVRCAIYTRKSTDEGLEQEFNSLDAQREAAEAFVTSQAGEGWKAIPLRYDDGGFTGGNMERPALQRLLADIKDKKIDCVIVYKVDRLSRSLLDFAKLIETFEKHKVPFVSVTQQFNTANSMGRLVLNVLLSFAQFEREIIGERIRDKIAATKKKGKWSGGFPVLGYDVDRSGPSAKLVPNARELPRVREIFQLYLKLGAMLPVVDELSRRNWKNKENRTTKGDVRGGKLFDKCSLHALLTNPIYIGRVRHQTNVYPGEHEAIVDKEVSDEVQNMMRKNARCGGPLVRNKHGALLRGLLCCKGCDRTMVHTYTQKGGRIKYRYYTCTKAIKSGRRACPSPSLPAGEAEKVVVDQIRALTSDAGLRAEVIKQANAQYDAEIAEMMNERVQLERELARHVTEIRKLATSGASDSATTALIADLHEKIASAETRSKELEDLVHDREKDRLTHEDVVVAFEDFDTLWDALIPREQASIIHLLISRIEFDPKESSVSVTFHPTAIRTLMNTKLGGAAA